MQGSGGLKREERAHLIHEEHGKILWVSDNPLPSHDVGTRRGPSVHIAWSEDLVGTGGGDKGDQGEERAHVNAKGVNRIERKRRGQTKSTRVVEV